MEAKGRQVVAGLRGEVRRSIASLDDLLSRTGAPRPDRSDGDCQAGRQRSLRQARRGLCRCPNRQRAGTCGLNAILPRADRSTCEGRRSGRHRHGAARRTAPVSRGWPSRGDWLGAPDRSWDRWPPSFGIILHLASRLKSSTYNARTSRTIAATATSLPFFQFATKTQPLRFCNNLQGDNWQRTPARQLH